MNIFIYYHLFNFNLKVIYAFQPNPSGENIVWQGLAGKDFFRTKAEDMTVPIITDPPSDFSVEYGYTGVSISWTATDLHSNNYTIELQESGTVAGPTAWSSGVAIIYNVPDGLAVGDYIYIVNFTDDEGNFISDSVTMTIEKVATGEAAIPFGNFHLFFLVIGIISIAIVQKRRRQLTSN